MTTVAQDDMPFTKGQMKRWRAEAGDVGRANKAARLFSATPVDDDETKWKIILSNNIHNQRIRLYRLIKGRVTRLSDLDIAADDASLEKLNVGELNDLKKPLDRHLKSASSHNFLPIVTCFEHRARKRGNTRSGPAPSNFYHLQQRLQTRRMIPQSVRRPSLRQVPWATSRHDSKQDETFKNKLNYLFGPGFLSFSRATATRAPEGS
jgi:hypothetical protein